MKYNIGDRYILASIECRVALVNVHGHAYLVPEEDSELPEYDNSKLLRGVVFAVVDLKGKDKFGNKLYPYTTYGSGAV